MRNLTLVVCFAVSMTLGCSKGASDRPAIPPRLTQDEIDLAGQIYSDQACSICHGESAEGMEGGPALRGLAPYWTVDRLATYLKDPQGFVEANRDFDDRRDAEYELEMPSYDHVADDELRALARWLMSRP